jgi:hypothetical protein
MSKTRQRRISVEHTIEATPQVIFAVLADPTQHVTIDGSRTLQDREPESSSNTMPLTLGATFCTPMRRWPAGLHMTDIVQATIATACRGVMRNTVVEFIENERIAWRNFGHHIWRYELRPVGTPESERTLVRETFDYQNNIAPLFLEIAGFPGRNADAMTATLRNLERRCARKTAQPGR